ncbi:MAG TPA: CHAT domain-containing protein [Thermoanaerobaculia bacterium]|nr:CHAT domain-containing protein [Thermoanaerobaculia bacterium]
MSYEDLIIQLGNDAEGHTVRVVRSPAGESELERLSLHIIDGEVWGIEAFGRTVDSMSLDRDLLPIKRAAKRPIAEIGEHLFHALFTGTVLSLYQQSLGRVAERGQGLRIRIEAGLGSAELAYLQAVPWEYLTNNGHFLVLSRETSIVRHLSLGLPSDRPPVPPPLCVLVLAGETLGESKLGLVEEQHALEQAWSEPGFTPARIHLLPDCTLDALREELLAREYHALHFMGHGTFSAVTGGGMLAFRTKEGHRTWVSGTELAEQLRDRSSLRLVFLNACQTAQFNITAPYTGVATALLRAGIPAVVAMQLPISDSAAIVLSRAFYRRVARGDTVDAAITEGRMAIRRMLPSSTEWATPVLFERLTSGQIVEPWRQPQPEQVHSRSKLQVVLTALLLVGALALTWLGLRSRQEQADSAQRPFSSTAAPIVQSRVLRGEILDAATGSPLSGVVVQLPELRLQEVTDTMGQYRFEIPARPINLVKLRATLEGYRSLNLDLTPGSGHLNAHQMLRTR